MTDPRFQPAYLLSDAARYLRMSPSTMGDWLRADAPVTLLPPSEGRYLSFENLVEIHAMLALRAEGFSMQKVRKAIATLRSLNGGSDIEYPFASRRLLMDKSSIYLEKFGELISLTEPRQLAMERILRQFLERVDFAPDDLAERFYPFTSPVRGDDAPRRIMIDPRVSFGAPVIRGSGVKTAIVVAQFRAGDKVEDIAEAYGRTTEEIQEAIRCEMPEAA